MPKHMQAEGEGILEIILQQCRLADAMFSANLKAVMQLKGKIRPYPQLNIFKLGIEKMPGKTGCLTPGSDLVCSHESDAE